MEPSVRAAAGEIRERERLAAGIGVSMGAMEAFCDRWRVGELALFGSVLRDDFGPDSDIDVLIRVPNARTRRAMAESEEMMRRGTARFASADEMFTELEEACGQ